MGDVLISVASVGNGMWCQFRSRVCVSSSHLKGNYTGIYLAGAGGIWIQNGSVAVTTSSALGAGWNAQTRNCAHEMLPFMLTVSSLRHRICRGWDVDSEREGDRVRGTRKHG